MGVEAECMVSTRLVNLLVDVSFKRNGNGSTARREPVSRGVPCVGTGFKR
jgi:hypothetical protein